MRNKMNKSILVFLMITLGWLMSVTTYAQSVGTQSNPIVLLQYIADNMIAGLKAHKATLKTKPQIVYQLANRYVVPYADIAGMSRRVLPPQIWNSATASERAQFEREFTTTLVRTYASSLTAYQDQVIKFYPIRGGYEGLATVEVGSEIDSSQSEPIHVSYRLMRIGSAWRLYDLSVEGVSMLESFRAQFADILSQGNMQQLLQRMSQHSNRSFDD